MWSDFLDNELKEMYFETVRKYYYTDKPSLKLKKNTLLSCCCLADLNYKNLPDILFIFSAKQTLI